MAENKHTISDLYQMQSLPLSAKLAMTEYRIRKWVDEFGQDGVYVSFSGGKDSTVLLDIVRNKIGYKNIPAMFVDVPTQYPELREFAKTWDNVDIVSPRLSFVQVCDKYGFPLISKEVSQTIYWARTYLRDIQKAKNAKNIKGAYAIADILGIERRSKESKERYERLKRGIIPKDYYDKLPKIYREKLEDHIDYSDYKIENISKRYEKGNYAYFLEAPFEISNMCCLILKKSPAHTYYNRTNRKPITAQMADESALRTSAWLVHGCNGFDMKIPTSNPMSFWTEQDILQYIKENDLKICPVYGDIVEQDIDNENQIKGQMNLLDKKTILKTTGCSRTGCMMCGFGCHLEKQGEGRFEMLKQSHPKMYGLLDICKNNGATFREAIEWTNEHGNLNINL